MCSQCLRRPHIDTLDGVNRPQDPNWDKSPDHEDPTRDRAAFEGGYGYPPAPSEPPMNPFPPMGFGPNPYYPAVPPYPLAQPMAPGTNGLAIASLVLSLACCGPFGLILGLISLRQLKTSGEEGYGLALAGTIISGITTALFIGYAILVVVMSIWA